MPIPLSGDILIRASWLGGSYSLIDVISREHIAGPFNDFAGAVAEARHRHPRAIWQQHHDTRGRPLGEPFRVPDIQRPRELMAGARAIAKGLQKTRRWSVITSVPVPAREPEPPIVRPVWALQRGDRCVVAVVRQWSYVPGLELLITLDGALRWARLYREASDLEREAEHKHRELTERGWTPE